MVLISTHWLDKYSRASRLQSVVSLVAQETVFLGLSVSLVWGLKRITNNYPQAKLTLGNLNEIFNFQLEKKRVFKAMINICYPL